MPFARSPTLPVGYARKLASVDPKRHRSSSRLETLVLLTADLIPETQTFAHRFHAVRGRLASCHRRDQSDGRPTRRALRSSYAHADARSTGWRHRAEDAADILPAGLTPSSCAVSCLSLPTDFAGVVCETSSIICIRRRLIGRTNDKVDETISSTMTRSELT